MVLEDVEKYAKQNKIDFISNEDYTLHNIGAILKDNNKPYLKYTPFYKKAILKIPNPVNPNTKFSFIKDQSSSSLKEMERLLKPKENKNIFVNGGRKNALLIIEKLKSKNVLTKFDDDYQSCIICLS